jgi:Condensation domain
VDDAYPLAPMQHEMLSAALEHAEPGLHVATALLRIDGAGFDERAFISSWQYLMRRHAVFRSSFSWHGLPRPLQSAWNIEAAPVIRLDLRGIAPADQEQRLAQALLAERRLVFDLTCAPQWRITLFALGRDSYCALMRSNYMFQDGWSFSNVQRELFATYDAFCRGGPPDLPAVPAFAEYIDWLASRPAVAQAADAEYWTAVMRRHHRTPVLATLGRARHVGQEEIPYRAEKVTVSPDVEQGVRRAAQDLGVTLFTLLQGAWALLLAAITGQDEVTFGVISSGRPEQIARVTEMVGPFNNMLPVPVLVPDSATATTWLGQLQRDQVELRQHHYASLAQIREWAGLPWREPLYDSYLVFENFPMDAASGERLAAWQPMAGTTQTEHPLRVMIWPAGGLLIEISYYKRYFDAELIRRLLRAYEDLVVRLGREPDRILADLKRTAAESVNQERRTPGRLT